MSKGEKPSQIEDTFTAGYLLGTIKVDRCFVFGGDYPYIQRYTNPPEDGATSHVEEL